MDDERVRASGEESLLSSFDVVDLAVVPEGFRERALREGTAL